MNIADAINSATEKLHAAGTPEPARDTKVLLAETLGREKTFLIAYPEFELPAEDAERFALVIERRAGREPLQHILGRQEFYGRDFRVSRDVLIPRPETEALVELAVEYLAAVPEPRFLDIGTGSGCIAISIAAEVPAANGVATDISPKALDIARENADKHGVADRIQFIEASLFGPAGDEEFELIAANPPYISEVEHRGLEPEVRDFEPRAALTDEGDGLAIIRAIIKGSPRYLKPGGKLLIEIGSGQSGAVAAMIDHSIWQASNIHKDLQGIPRVLEADKRADESQEL
ncbi:MAG: peptide chain release factor N(5)-glutamine methyltransferase [Acidobacteria bacterium]|nr:peptide chain release factor N(5)-glutamine methyltransferase [Acidobacteriota bacterium]